MRCSAAWGGARERLSSRDKRGQKRARCRDRTRRAPGEEEEMEEGATPQPRRAWTPLALTPFLRKSRWDGRLLCSGDIWAGQAREAAEARR